jgi:hypothetical protein
MSLHVHAHTQVHGGRIFLKEYYSCPPGQEIPSRVMEPVGSLMCSQEPATKPYTEPQKSRPQPHTLYKIHYCPLTDIFTSIFSKNIISQILQYLNNTK